MTKWGFQPVNDWQWSMTDTCWLRFATIYLPDARHIALDVMLCGFGFYLSFDWGLPVEPLGREHLDGTP